MAVVLIVRFVLAVAVGFASFYVLAPIIYNLAYNTPGMWQNVDSQLLAVRDNLYGVWLLMAVVIMGVLILWGFSNANRKRAEESFN